MPTPSLLQRLKERKLVQWAVAYLAGAWVLVESSSLVVERFHWPEVISQAIIILAFFGFLLTLILAWFHGEKGRQRVGGRELLIVVAVLLVAGVVLSTLEGPGDAPLVSLGREGDDRPGIAVLPCANMSADPADAYLASALHDEILLRLQGISSLFSIGRTSVLPYADAPPAIYVIAAELGVGFVGECSVQKYGEQIRLIFQLLDGRTGGQVWADDFDRTLNTANLFEIQMEIAQEVAGAVGAELTPEEQVRASGRPTENLSAYDLYLKGLEYWNRPGTQQENYDIAERFWEQAIQADPEFAGAHAMLSFLHGAMRVFSRDLSQENLDAQRREAEEAIRLQPDLAEARFALAFIDYVAGDYQTAVEGFEGVLEVSPNHAAASGYLGYSYRRLENWEAWERAYQRTVRLNPRNSAVHWNLGGLTLGFLRRFSEAVQATTKALEVAPDLTSAAVQKANLFIRWKGETDSLRTVLERLPQTESQSSRLRLAWYDRDPDRIFEFLKNGPEMEMGQVLAMPMALWEARGYQLRGDLAAARHAFERTVEIMEAFRDDNPDDFRVWEALGFAYAGLGETDAAAESARRFVADSPNSDRDSYLRAHLEVAQAKILAQAGLTEIAIDLLDDLLSRPAPISVPRLRIDPIWDPLRDHPRFQALLEEYRGDVGH